MRDFIVRCHGPRLMVFPNAILYEDLAHVQTKRASLQYVLEILLHVQHILICVCVFQSQLYGQPLVD